MVSRSVGCSLVPGPAMAITFIHVILGFILLTMLLLGVSFDDDAEWTESSRILYRGQHKLPPMYTSQNIHSGMPNSMNPFDFINTFNTLYVYNGFTNL